MEHVPPPTPPNTVAQGAKKGEAVVINLAGADKTPAFPKFKQNKSGGWISFGVKNDFPQEVIKYNSRSPANKAIIDSTVTYICGKKVAGVDGKFIGVPNTDEDWGDIIEKIAKDYKQFGGFYFQVIVNKGSTTVSLFHQDFSTVRVGEITAAGKPVSFMLSNDWTKTSGKDKPVEIPVWQGITSAKKGVAYLFYFWDYEPGLTCYCIPKWYPAIEYVKADGTLGEFYNNSIDNGFTPSVVISMPSNPDEEKKEAFQRQMEEAFAGAKGASSIVILWGENEGVKPAITPYNATANADVYNNVEGIIFQKIISAHRLSSPTLAGISGSGNLSGNAAEIVNSFVLYNYTVVYDYRAKILKCLNLFTSINKLAALVIEDLDVLEKIRETDNSNESILTIKDGSAAAATVESLASKLGVGGTQALTAIMESPTLNDTQKRGMMSVLFGLSEDEISTLFNGSKTKLSFTQRLKARLSKWK